MNDNLLDRKDKRAISSMKMRNQYPSVHRVQHYFVVEGPTDISFFQQIIDYKTWKIQRVKGKDDVLEYMKSAYKNSAIAIVDADFEHITGITSARENVFITDCHDIEMMIFKSNPNLKKLYSEFANRWRIDEYEKNSSFMRDVFNASYEIGLLKLVNFKKNYGMKIESDLYSFVLNNDFTVDIDELINRVKNRITIDEIKNCIEEERKKKYDEYQVICGHDVTDILGLSFMTTKKSGLGYGDNTKSKASEIEVCLRAIYDIQKFKNTDIYNKIIDWEKQNNVKVLGPDFLNSNE